MVLQPESYEIAYNVERPTAKAGFMADELFPLYKDNKMSDEDIIKIWGGNFLRVFEEVERYAAEQR